MLIGQATDRRRHPEQFWIHANEVELVIDSTRTDVTRIAQNFHCAHDGLFLHTEVQCEVQNLLEANYVKIITVRVFPKHIGETLHVHVLIDDSAQFPAGRKMRQLVS
ncbi:hypothetical protein WJ08_18230 [Burkholderia vietnamiensis]|nr:hypothetical protein WJ08_18230 [Burkholderia vietnamiensis]KVF42798.1 hypothetical protein WJ10_11740 [Burkholderia vietnamiensis]